MAINLISPSTSTTANLIADTYTATDGSSDSIPTMTKVDGVTVAAALEIQSTLGAVLLPRMTDAQMNDLTPPDNGMLIFNTDHQLMYQYSSDAWQAVEAGSGIGDVIGPASSVTGDIAIFANTSGKLLADSGVNIDTEILLSDINAFSPLVADPSGIALKNLTYIQFLEANASGFFFVGTKSAMSFYDEGPQVNTVISGIVAEPPSSTSSLFEINSTTGALLLSRMDTTQRDALVAPQAGMMIFNTATVQFNFYDGTAWIAFSGGGLPAVTANYQLLSTVTGTPAWYSFYHDGGAGTHNLFIANNKATPVIAGTNNVAIGRSAGSVLSSGSNNAGVGFNALLALASGSRNSAFGSQALPVIDTSSDNSGFGFQAGLMLSSGAFNSAFGSIALTSETTGSQNSAVGYGALATQVTSSGNSAFGYSAGTSKASYTNCTFIGKGADASVNALTNATAIGASASVGQSNSLILGNNVHVGIGTSAPNTSSILDLTSTTGALLLPRMTDTQRNALTAAAGMTIYDSSSSQLQYYNGSTWVGVASGGTAITWVDQTTTSVTMAANTGYVADNAGLVTLTLPASASFGTVFVVQGKGTGGWKIAQNAAQTINLGNTPTTAGVTGFLSSSNLFDSVTLVCITANTAWAAYGAVGNININ